MVKSGRTPEGYYSASQAMRKLGIGSSTLHHFVEVGKIRKAVPLGMKTGYYPQEDIDKLARERAIFLQTTHEGQIFVLTQEEKLSPLNEQDQRTILERLDAIEKRLDEQGAALAQILERLAKIIDN